MASAIERFLFGELADQVSLSGEVGGHCLHELAIGEDEIRLVIMRCDESGRPRTVRFPAARLYELRQTTQYPEELELPWIIRGCDDRDLGAASDRIVDDVGTRAHPQPDIRHGQPTRRRGAEPPRPIGRLSKAVSPLKPAGSIEVATQAGSIRSSSRLV